MCMSVLERACAHVCPTHKYASVYLYVNVYSCQKNYQNIDTWFCVVYDIQDAVTCKAWTLENLRNLERLCDDGAACGQRDFAMMEQPAGTYWDFMEYVVTVTGSFNMDFAMVKRLTGITGTFWIVWLWFQLTGFLNMDFVQILIHKLGYLNN